MKSTFVLISISCILTPLGLTAQSLAPSSKIRVIRDIYSVERPAWGDGGAAIVASNNTASPRIELLDNNGLEAPPISVVIAGATSIEVAGASRGHDGVVAVTGTAYDKDGRTADFLSIIAGDSQSAQIVRTRPYHARYVVVAPDGSIWTAGREAIHGYENVPAVNQQHGVLRHFDKNGALIGSFVPRSSLSKDADLINGHLATAGGRAGWYAGYISKPGEQYFEVGADGKVRGYPGIFSTPEVQALVTGLALTDNGATFAGVQRNVPGGKSVVEVYELDHSSGTWSRVDISGMDGPTLVGANGNTLMFQSKEFQTLTKVDVARP